MTPLLARVMLAIFLPPFAAIVYFATLESVTSTQLVARPGNVLVAGLATWTFVAVYWFLVWHRTFAWTTRRRVGTVLSVLVASAAALVLGMSVGAICSDVDLGIFLATIVAPLAWLMLTLLAWRESPEERSTRRGAPAARVPCPTCGYDLTGLRGTRCPECGTEFTLDQLLAALRIGPGDD